MNYTKTTFRLPEDLYFKVKSVAIEEDKTTNDIVIAALKMYCERNALQNNVQLLNENILAAMEGLSNRMEQQITGRLGKKLDDLNVEQQVLTSVIGDNLEVPPEMVAAYRRQARENINEALSERFTKF